METKGRGPTIVYDTIYLIGAEPDERRGLNVLRGPVFRKGETPIVFVVFSITIGEEPDYVLAFALQKTLINFNEIQQAGLD